MRSNNSSSNNNCGCSARKRRRCGCMKMARSCWDNFPYYTGPCPNVAGCYSWGRCDDDDDDDDNTCERDCERRRCRRHDWHCDRDCRRDCVCDCDNDDDDNDDDHCKRRRHRRRYRGRGPCCGMFVAYLPVAVSANGIIPLVFNNPCKSDDFGVNSGLVTVEKAGTYLATYTVRVPETAVLDTTITLNVDNASQASAVTQVLTEAGTTTSTYTAQAIIQADEGDTVSLRSSEAINVTDTAVQPLFTLSLTKLGDE